MFNDVDNKTSDNLSEGGDNTSPKVPSVVPPASPTNKEETPEASVQPVPASVPASPEVPKSPPVPAASKPNAGVEDIFSDTDASDTEPVKPDAFQPKADTAPAEELGAEEPKGNKLRKIIIPIVLIVALGAIGAGGVYGYKYVVNLIGAENAEENKQDNIVEPTDVKTAETKPEDTIEPQEVAEPIQVPPSSPTSVTPPLDTDGDGLSDQEEITLGTNINSVDTDNDGLFDREEVYVYKTDPINEDTDGDGYADGAEVQDGYNPNGQGKLYEIN